MHFLWICLSVVKVRVVEKGEIDEHAKFEVDEVRRLAATAAAAARASIPEGGGTGAAAAEAVAQQGSTSAHAESSLLASESTANEHNPKDPSSRGAFQMRPNVTDGEAAPLFVPGNRDAWAKTGGSISNNSAKGGKDSKNNIHSDDYIDQEHSGTSQIEGWYEDDKGRGAGARSGRTKGRGGRGRGQNSRLGEDGGRGRNKGRMGRGRGGGGGGGAGRGEESVSGESVDQGSTGVAKQRHRRQAMRVQDIAREDIFDGFAEDARVLYGDTSAAEAARCG
jgi:hypothetical protein